jgi:hypothetical protein
VGDLYLLLACKAPMGKIRQKQRSVVAFYPTFIYKLHIIYEKNTVGKVVEYISYWNI